MFNEAVVTINGKRLTEAQSMTLRVAISSFGSSSTDGSLGDDEHGMIMAKAYRERSREIFEMMVTK
jgi:hypothetical protein